MPPSRLTLEDQRVATTPKTDRHRYGFGPNAAPRLAAWYFRARRYASDRRPSSSTMKSASSRVRRNTRRSANTIHIAGKPPSA